MSRGRLLRQIARELFGDEVAKKLWGRIEVIGDIALLRKSPDIDVSIYKEIAEELMRRLPYVKSVWLAITPIRGTYRVREYVHLAGENRSTTYYKEHGCVFKIDIKDVYISPALNYEHGRIAKLVREGEYVANMFAGAGFFSIIIAKYSKPREVISIDINPKAYELMIENVRLNKVENVVKPILGDAGEVMLRYPNRFDRVLMPLPELALKYLDRAIYGLKKEGFVHVYDFISCEKRDEALRIARNIYSSRLMKLGIKEFKVVFSRVVRSVGPRYYQVVLDLLIKK